MSTPGERFLDGHTIRDEDVDFDAFLHPDERRKLRDASTYRQEIEAEIEKAASGKPPPGVTLPWAKADSLRFRDGELTIWTGYSGHKKSMMLGYAALAFLAQLQKVCIASLEMAPRKTLIRMCRQFTGQPMPDAGQREYFFDWCEERLWLYDQVGTVKPDRMLAVVRYATQELGIRHFVVDSLMKCGMGMEDYDRQKHFVDGLCAAAKDAQAHVHLVAHARKPDTGKETQPSTKYGVKGASEITDMADNVLVVFTPREGDGADYDTALICEKQRNGEAEPKFKSWFDVDSLQFKPEMTAPRMAPQCWSGKLWR